MNLSVVLPCSLLNGQQQKHLILFLHSSENFDTHRFVALEKFLLFKTGGSVLSCIYIHNRIGMCKCFAVLSTRELYTIIIIIRLHVLVSESVWKCSMDSAEHVDTESTKLWYCTFT